MSSHKLSTFKGEIENYQRNDQNNSDSEIDDIFASLRVRTLLRQTDIIKKRGFHAAHLLFIPLMPPLLKLNTIHSFCQKQQDHQSSCGKDAFYRFKLKTRRWRTFMYKLNLAIFHGI